MTDSTKILPFDEQTNAALVKFAEQLGLADVSEMWTQLRERTPEFESKITALGYEYKGPYRITKIETA